jgi:PII-like signaling protein
VDSDEAIQRFMKEVDALVQEGLVTLEKVKIVSYGEGAGPERIHEQA